MKGRTAAWTSAGVVCGLVMASSPALGAGFAVLEQSTKRLGNAYAGSGAMADDASEVWYNPAAAVHLDRSLQLGFSVIEPGFEYSNPRPINSPGSLPLLASSRLKADGGETAAVPNLAYSALVGDNWYAGFTVNAPFGLATDYDDNWVGRYQTLRSEIQSININPFIAYRFDDQLSIGFGLSVNQTDVSLSRAVDFAAICAGAVGSTTCPNGAVPGARSFDGEVEVEGDDVGWGYNFGLLWSPSDSTRLSFSYRSEIEFDLSGEGDFDQPVGLGGFSALGPVLGAGLGATFSDSDAEAELTLPDSLSLSLRQQLGTRTALLADITHTGWSSMEEIRVDFENPLTPTAVEVLDWEDTMRYSIGIDYAHNDEWTFRSGLAWDETPVPNALARTPRLPDNDRLWLGIGASRSISEQATLDLAYAHIFIDDTDIYWEQPDGGLLAGEYESTGDVLSLSLSVNF